MKRVYEAVGYLEYLDTLDYLSELLGRKVDDKMFKRLFLPSLYFYLNLDRCQLTGKSMITDEQKLKSAGGYHRVMYDSDSVIFSLSEFGAYISYLDEDSLYLKGDCTPDDAEASVEQRYHFWKVDESEAAFLSLHHGYGKYLELDGDIPRLFFKVEDIQDLMDSIAEGREETKGKIESTNKNSVSIQERVSLLKIILGLAQDVHHYDPAKVRNNAIGDIERSLERQGLGMDRKTIKKYLDEARSLFPAKPIDT